MGEKKGFFGGLFSKKGCCSDSAKTSSCCCACATGNTTGELLVLGSGCKSCQTLEANTRTALEHMGNISASIGHVTDFTEIARYGVMTTPALVVDGKVVSSGKVLKPEEIEGILREIWG